MFRVLQKSLRWAVPCAWLLVPAPLHAVDEETSKTISDLKTQVQALVDEVKKLKDQYSELEAKYVALLGSSHKPQSTPSKQDKSEKPEKSEIKIEDDHQTKSEPKKDRIQSAKQR